MDESRNCIFVARKEYTTLLVYSIYPAIYQGLKSIWEDAKETEKNRPREVFREFQMRLKRVRKWNQDVIDNEYRRILEKSKCSYLEDLIKRIFVLNTQILAAVNMRDLDPNRKIKVKVPQGDKFVHCVYKECARAFFENVLLMEDREGSISRVEQLKNMQRAYKLIMTCIENTIRNLLPIESLLHDSMDDQEGEDATPPATLFRNLRGLSHSDEALHPLVPETTNELEKNPLSSFPTLNSVLQSECPDKDPSTGSLQPSMNDLGSVPLPAETPRDIQGIYGRFNEKDEKDERDGKNEKENDPAAPDNALEKWYRPTDGSPLAFTSDSTKIVPSQPENLPETKTIFLGNNAFRRRSFSGISQRREETERHEPYHSGRFGIPTRRDGENFSHRLNGGHRPDDVHTQNSDDSDPDNARSKRDIGGEVPHAASADVPMVHQTYPQEKIDLDVYSCNNELPLNKRSKSREDDIESRRSNAIPPLEPEDTKNFFSDAE